MCDWMSRPEFILESAKSQISQSDQQAYYLPVSQRIY